MAALAYPLRRRLLRGGRSDRGYVAITYTLMMGVMLGICALAIDWGLIFLQGQRAQKAADAAALAGVVSLPGNQTGAFSTARTYSGRNGFTNGVGSTTVTPAVGANPNQLKVTVNRNVETIFGKLLGLPSVTVSREAVADYLMPIEMGSPCNMFGDDPTRGPNRSANCAQMNQFWANISTPASSKVNGDALTSTVCGGADACSGGVNADRDPTHYWYKVTLRRDMSNVTFQTFDGGFSPTGWDCYTSLLTATSGIYRRATAANSPYSECTGDLGFTTSTGGIGTSWGSSGKFSTTFTVLRDGGSANPWDPSSYTPVCSRTYGSYDPTSAPTGDFQTWFHRWSQVCSMATAPAGTYFIHVESSSNSSYQGSNKFSLGVWSTSDASAKDSINVTGYKAMGVGSNAPNAVTKFYLARLPREAAGNILNIRLFDLGDAKTPSGSNVNVSVTVYDPRGNIPTGCRGADGSTATPTALSTCRIIGNYGVTNGLWQRIQVPIPTNYTCDNNDYTDCWYRLEVNYGSGVPTEVTTWSTNLEGNPVRLVR